MTNFTACCTLARALSPRRLRRLDDFEFTRLTLRTRHWESLLGLLRNLRLYTLGLQEVKWSPVTY